DEDTDDDGRHAEQDVIDEADHRGQPRLLAELGQIGACQHPDRRADQHAGAHHHQAADDGVGQAARSPRRRGALSEHRRREPGQAVREQRPQQPAQPEQAKGSGQYRRGEVEGVDQAAASVESRIHVVRPSWRLRRSNSSLASASTMKVIRNSSSPSAISADTYSSPCASANSLASAEEMVLPGMNRDRPSTWALPMTKVTAMVSPRARPSPSMMPPTTPTLV